jgi:hypothetical protein
MKKFNLRKLNEAEGKEKFNAEISKRFAALADLDTEVYINNALKRLEKALKFQPKGIKVSMK